MRDDGPVTSIITALQQTLGDLGWDEFSDLKCDQIRDEFRFAFHWGEAGGIAASAGTLGIKARELCDDISDAWEENDVEFLRHVIGEIRKRRKSKVRSTANPNSNPASSLPALVEVLAEAVMACTSGQRQRFALMSGFAAGLLFSIPASFHPHTGREMVDGAMQYHRVTLGSGEVDSSIVDDFVSSTMERKLQDAFGARGREVVTYREAVIAAYESDSAGIMEWLRALMAHYCGHEGLYAASPGRYAQEEIDAMRWTQNFGLRRSRVRKPFTAIPDGTKVRMMTRQYARWAQGWDGNNDLPNPIEMCYWVVPGRLLAGEYPRNLDTPSSIEKLARLTDSGVSAFIDLTEDQEPLKPYAYLLNGPSHERFGIRDRHVPATDELTKQALDAIDRHLEAGRTVYVHCWGGVGRTGTIIGCWLSRHYEPGQSALDRLKKMWNKNPKHLERPRSPENDEQERYVLEWGDKEVSIAARYQGCLTGLAAGDAVGTTVEFKSPGSFKPVSDMVGGGPFHLQPGQWTDDTSMALCLAESLVSCEGFHAGDQMDRYVRWWQEGYLSSTGSCFDIGNATADALSRYRQSDHALVGSTNPQTAGNGSLMRLAPVAMFFAADPELAIRLCGESSRTTHGARTCIDACRYFGGLIVGALRGATKEELLSERYCPVVGLWEQAPLCTEIAEIAAGSFKRLEPPDIVGSGYVVKSLEAALWAFHRSETFEEGCLKAVNLGNDDDTTAAIYGQIAGAFYGMDGIPSGWREKLADRELISNFASSLHSKGRERIT